MHRKNPLIHKKRYAPGKSTDPKKQGVDESHIIHIDLEDW